MHSAGFGTVVPTGAECWFWNYCFYWCIVLVLGLLLLLVHSAGFGTSVATGA